MYAQVFQAEQAADVAGIDFADQPTFVAVAQQIIAESVTTRTPVGFPRPVRSE
jgi:hypothetical protein